MLWWKKKDAGREGSQEGGKNAGQSTPSEVSRPAKRGQPDPPHVQRKYGRFEKSLSVASKDLKYYKTVAKDISLGGICLYTEEALPEGKELELRIDFEGSLRPLCATGKVVWRRLESVNGKYQVGIEFLNLSLEDRELIAQYIRHMKSTLSRLTRDE